MNRTPIQEARAGLRHVWVKRDDLFEVAGVRGGKVRTCDAIILAGMARGRGAGGVVTAGSRSSPQVHIVARLAQHYGLACQVHVPHGRPGPEVEAAQANGAEVVPWAPGYNTQIARRARLAAEARGWIHVPFGMECQEAADQTAAQVGDFPAGVQRVVVPVGSGMTLAGVLRGMASRGLAIPVLGVRVGADPAKRLGRYAAPWAPGMTLGGLLTLVTSGLKYDQRAPYRERFLDVIGTGVHGGSLALDPIYEAKCAWYLRDGDLLWVVGIRASPDGPAA